MFKLSKEARDAIWNFWNAGKDKDAIAIGFSFSIPVDSESPLGRAISNQIGRPTIERLAAEEFPKLDSNSWQFSIAGYDRAKLQQSELEWVDEIPFYIPSDISGFVEGKELCFEGSEFSLVSDRGSKVPGSH